MNTFRRWSFESYMTFMDKIKNKREGDFNVMGQLYGKISNKQEAYDSGEKL